MYDSNLFKLNSNAQMCHTLSLKNRQLLDHDIDKINPNSMDKKEIQKYKDLLYGLTNNLSNESLERVNSVDRKVVLNNQDNTTFGKMTKN